MFTVMAQIEYIKSSKLVFDKENPRLVEFNSSSYSENQIVNLLWTTMAVEELVMSIVAQGFFEHEPLYVIKSSGEKYIVIEGNRRLAAIKSILNPTLVKGGKMDKYLSALTEGTKSQLENRIPVIILQKREDAWRLLGFKHVNGPAKWGSFAKAKYISVVHNMYNIDLVKIAEQIGDTNKTVLKLYQGLMVLEQAQSQAEFSIDDILSPRIFFSHLYTAIGYEKFRSYIGISDDFEEPNPVPPDRIKNLQEIMDWLYGSKKRGVSQKVQSQNPHLRMLIEILDNDMSVAALRSGNSLELAYDLSINDTDALKDAFVKAKVALEKAAAKLGNYDGDEGLLKQAGKIANLADSIYDRMDSIRIAKTSGKKERLTE